jgi:hypothetical protein
MNTGRRYAANAQARRGLFPLPITTRRHFAVENLRIRADLVLTRKEEEEEAQAPDGSFSWLCVLSQANRERSAFLLDCLSSEMDEMR